MHFTNGAFHCDLGYYDPIDLKLSGHLSDAGSLLTGQQIVSTSESLTDFFRRKYRPARTCGIHKTLSE